MLEIELHHFIFTVKISIQKIKILGKICNRNFIKGEVLNYQKNNNKEWFSLNSSIVQNTNLVTEKTHSPFFLINLIAISINCFFMNGDVHWISPKISISLWCLKNSKVASIEVAVSSADLMDLQWIFTFAENKLP